MLYYVLAFLKALFTQPRNIVKVTRRLYKTWRIDKISKKHNEVVFIDERIKFCRTLSIGDRNHNDSCYIHLRRIIEYIGLAKCSIDIALYTLNSIPICRALSEAYQRGINVRIITEKNFLPQLFRIFDEIDLKGIPIVVPLQPTERIMHHKFCILDGYRRGRELRKPRGRVALLLTGSFNWIGFTHNYDDLLITSNVRLVLQLEREFLRIWREIESGNI